MFIDVNYNKRLKQSKLHLAKPNKQIISHISEKFRHELSLKLGNINELNFSIPHSITDEETNQQIYNSHVDLIKEKMLIKVTLDGYREWYIVNSIEEDGDNSDVFNVKCFSLGHELAGKRISQLEEISINATALLNKLLSKTLWSIGEVDPIFDVMLRSFESGNNSNVLDSLFNAVETYGALLVWDTENRKVSFKDMSQNGKFRGMSVNYGKFLNSIKRTRTTDEMVTRLYVYGSEDLQIHSVNPTGMPYIEDFNFFMHPFERDAERNIITSSHFMSDDLCHAILDHQILLIQNAPQIQVLTNSLLTKQTLLTTEQTKLRNLELELSNIIALLDTAKATENVALIAQREAEKIAKELEISNQQSVVDGILLEITNINIEIQTKQNNISNQANFTEELLDELNLYVIEKEWRDDRYIDVKELYDDAIKKFEEIRKPKVVIEASIENILNIIEESYYWDKLVLGDLIKVKYPQMKIEYMAKIIEIKYDLENGEVNLVIANTTDLLSDTEKLVQLLYQNNSASSLIQNNKYKWDKVQVLDNLVGNILNSEWDATKNKIIAGVRNSVEVGNRGVIIRNPDFPNEIVIMQSGVIALSKDGGDTWKTAIKPDGIVAERLIGKIIAGQNLLITNNSGSFVMDNTGVRINASAFVVESGNNSNLVDIWNDSAQFTSDIQDDSMITGYEKNIIKTEWDRIKIVFDSYMVKLENYYEDSGVTLPFVMDYKTRYTSLYDFLFVTLHSGDSVPLLHPSNMSRTTMIDKEQYDSAFAFYNLSEATLDRELDKRANDLALQALGLAEEAQRNIDEVENDIVYKIELFSTNGLTFRNGVINTTIIATVYRGKDDITHTLPNSAFRWSKRDKDGSLDVAWNSSKVDVGRIITVTSSDVVQRATFSCDIDIP